MRAIKDRATTTTTATINFRRLKIIRNRKKEKFKSNE